MILADLKTYLAENGRATMPALARRFGADEDALRAMLAVWVAKGRVRAIEPGGACAGCTACAVGRCESYEWIGG